MLRLLAASLLLAAASPARAADMSDTVPGTDSTYLDYARKVVPGLDEDGTGDTPVEMRYVVDLGDGDGPPQPETPYVTRGFGSTTVQAGGHPVTIVTFELGQTDGWASGFQVLAAFDADGALLDAINIGLDMQNGIKEVFPISDLDEGIITYSEHFNSSQSYDAFALLMLQEGKIRTIDTIYTLSMRDCYIPSFDQSLHVAAKPAGEGFWPIEAVVTEERNAQLCNENEDVVEVVTETYKANYRWDAQAGSYVVEGDGFAKLDAANEPRY